MSLAQILGHLRTGDVIIVRGGDASLRLRLLPAMLGRPDAVDGNAFDFAQVAAQPDRRPQGRRRKK